MRRGAMLGAVIGAVVVLLVAAGTYAISAFLRLSDLQEGAAPEFGRSVETPAPADPNSPEEQPVAPETGEVPAGTAAVVDRVVDGDTVIVLFDGLRERVRLLNIDTPESVAEDQPIECLGPEASDFTADLLPEGTPVTLVFDVERTDQYDRLLAAVYLEDGRNASVEIARAGLAEPVTFQPNDRFRPDVDAAVEEARVAERGLWEPGACR